MFAAPAHSVRLLVALLGAAAPALADWRDEVGYTRLLQTYATGVPTAVTDGVTQVEATTSENDPADNYLPNAADSRFSGKSITNKSPGSGTSSHATSVGAKFYGLGASLIPDTTAIDAYNANHWLNSLPHAEPRRVQNHSWIVQTLNAANPPETTIPLINTRLDYMVNQYGFVCVVGVNNGYSTTLPHLLAQGYNLISVGRTDGQHSAGLTAYDGAGRIKPDLVAPDSVTSFASPQVASAAGLLSQKLSETPHLLSGANLPRSVKALLLAGATKDKFPAWSRATTQPIDTRHGAGELNILLAYRTLLGGRVSASPSQLLPDTAWATAQVRNVTQAGARTYFFEVPAGSVSPRFSAALVWHRPVTAGLGSYFAGPLANLDLTLYNVPADTFTLGSAVQTSASTVDNLEHIYVPELPAGRYALQVSSASGANTDYALAWRTLPTVTVVATTPVAREQDGSAGVFTITRTGPVTSPLLVPLAWGGSAVSGIHYIAPPDSLLIPAGAASATVSITPIGDSLAQGDRGVTLTLATDWSLSAGSPENATVTIEDKPYDAWRFARFSAEQLADAGVSGDSADPDRDGLGNLLEYALGGEPFEPDAATRRPSAAITPDGRLAITFFQPTGRSDLTYAVEWTDDLAAGWWTSDPGVVTETARVTTDGGELVTVRAEPDPATSPRQFLRLRVTRL